MATAESRTVLTILRSRLSHPGLNPFTEVQYREHRAKLHRPPLLHTMIVSIRITIIKTITAISIIIPISLPTAMTITRTIYDYPLLLLLFPFVTIIRGSTSFTISVTIVALAW